MVESGGTVATPDVEALLPADRADAISQPLLTWFRRAQRDLPWRRDTRPYAVWVSEIMLQQTQVATVIPYFQRWMERFPAVEALAAASEDAVLQAWEGLGYYSRARNLLRGAREVCERFEGRVPDRVDDLLSLPGVGRYTAGAIASIAYNAPAPIVDGNVIRVLSRVFGLHGDPARAPLKNRLWELAEALIPEGHARDFNPALMELGATVCAPVRPRCGECPLAGECVANRLGLQEQLPETAKRPQVTAVRMAAAVVWQEGRVLLVQRPPDASRWPSMWQFPNTELSPDETPSDGAVRAVREAVGLDISVEHRATVVRHSVTRYRIALEAFHCRPVSASVVRSEAPVVWVSPDELDDYALPAAHRKIAGFLHAEEGNGCHGQLTIHLGD